MQWLRHEAQVPSTNDVVLDWIRSGCEHGLALYADEQTAGRGRSGRTWIKMQGRIKNGRFSGSWNGVAGSSIRLTACPSAISAAASATPT